MSPDASARRERHGRRWDLRRLGLVIALFLIPPTGLFLYYGVRVAAHQTLAVYSVVPAQFRPPAMRHDPVLITSAYPGKPARVQAGTDTKIFISGTGMSNSCQVRFHPRYDYREAHSLNGSTLETQLPEDLLPGLYDVVVRNDRGHSAMLRESLDVYWVPRVDRVLPRKTYGGETIEIEGERFQANAAVWIGQQRSKNVEWVSPQRLRVRLQFEEELPPGTYDVRVSNGPPETDFTFDERLRPKARNADSSEIEFTLAEAVEILPRPRVKEIFPREILQGDQVDLWIQGEFFPPDAALLLSPHHLPLETVRVSSSQLRARVAPRTGWDGTYDLYLTLPDGAPVEIFPSAITIVPRTVQTALVEILLQENLPEETLHRLKSLSGWRWVRQVEVKPRRNFITRSTPIRQRMLVRVVIETALLGEAGGEPIRTLTYRGNRVKKGETITVTLGGQGVTGQVVSDPVPVLAESYAE